ncbi:ABC-type transport auxiliary lipoprotein family protein [Frateuria aurantia]|nr:ABC-type transport auxiliary lipoprotein family protein [Frateuria aurantia]
MTATVARLGTRLAALLGVISLGACSVLPRPDPPTVYALPQPQAPASTVTTVPEPEWSLQIATPLAPAAVNRSAITVLPRPDLVNNYRGARWSDPAPILFRDALVRRLQLSHPGAVITSDDSDVPTRYKLVGRLDAFQSEYRNGQPQIVIHYQAQLLGGDAQSAVAVRRFDISLAPGSTAVGDVVAGFGQAVQQLDGQVQAWLNAVIPASPPSASAASPTP